MFVVNAAEAFKKLFPGKKVRLVLHKKEDLEIIVKAKLLKGLESNTGRQEAFGMEVISTEDLGDSWANVQQNLFGQDDIAIVYALESDVNEVYSKESVFARWGAPAATVVKIVEFGLDPVFVDPLNNGWGHLGLGNDQIGMPP